MYNPILPFMSRNMCEYATIFPDPVSLLDHLFFVIGNGFSQRQDGMIINDEGKPIDSFEEPDQHEWNKIIDKCVEKEKNFALMYAGRSSKSMTDVEVKRMVEESEAEARKIYFPKQVMNKHLTTEDLFNQLKKKSQSRPDIYVRPYPFSSDFSKIYRLNEKTPAWFLQIALNFCQAWAMFLEHELATDHVFTDSNKTSDYADKDWTTKHLKMIQKLILKLDGFLKSKFPVGKVVKVHRKDPNQGYAGVAFPEVGVKGKVMEIRDLYADETRGKIAVSFKEKDLGYEESDKGDITLFMWPAQFEVMK